MSADDHESQAVALDDLGRISDTMSAGPAPAPIRTIPAGWEVVNPPVVQAWLAGWSVVIGFGTLVVGRDLLRPIGSQAWQAALVGLGLLAFCYVGLILNLWHGMATFVFGPDRILVRSWIDRFRRRPFRAFPRESGLALVFSGHSGISLRTPDGVLHRTEGRYVPPSALRRLIDVATREGLPIEYQWTPHVLAARDTRTWWQRLIGG